MKTLKTNIDFTNCDLYIGIDVHKRQWTIALQLNDVTCKTFSMNPSPKELYNYVTKHFPNANYYSVYEAGYCGYWIHRELCELGINNIIVNPADVPTTHKEKTQKRDKMDARKLVRELSKKNTLKCIYIPTKEQEARRQLSRLLVQVTKRTTQAKNRIKQFLHTQGIHLPTNAEITHWSRCFINYLDGLEFEYKNNNYYFKKLLRDLKLERLERLSLLTEMRTITKKTQTIRYLKTAPGFGIITAFTFYTEIMDISRFQKLDHLVAYIGLIPSVESSDEKEKMLGLTGRRNKFLRHLIIEAAWVAVRTDPALTMAFNNLLKTHSKQRAIIRIAKKLVNRMRYIWLNQKEYVTGVVE